jgi:hypothetical protein
LPVGFLFTMSKETFYFSHDYNARSDDKLKRLIRVHGMTGYGVFWSIVEDLYNNANALHTDYEGVAYDLRVNCDIVKSIINDFDLFCFEDGSFGSVSVERRLDERNSKSEKARQSAFKRWNKVKTDANALHSHSEGNAIKDSIVKDSIEKKENNTWRDDFSIYLSECKLSYNKFMEDSDLLKEQQRLNPGINVRLSIEKGFINFWGTEAGWKFKKSKKSKDIDWKRTIINSIDMNKVYYTRQELEKTGVQHVTVVNGQDYK